MLQGPYNASPEPEDLLPRNPDFWDLDQLLGRIHMFTQKLAKRFKKSKEALEEIKPLDHSCKPGNEIAQELTDAWNLYTRVTLGHHTRISHLHSSVSPLSQPLN